MDARRRNGRLASCEPCRKRKTSCDHRKPICTRCERKGQGARCVYHPAPMTRSIGATPPAELRSIRPNGGMAPPRNDVSAAQSTSSPNAVHQPILSADAKLRVQQVAALLRPLEHFDRMQELLSEYYSTSQGPVVPGAVVVAVLENLKVSTAVRQATNEVWLDGGSMLTEAHRTVTLSSSAIEILPSTTLTSFCTSLCGESIRLEALGIIYSVAARACKLVTRRDDTSQDDFIEMLYASSLDCRAIARDIAPLNDVLLWLTYENMVLCSYMHGDTSR